MERYFVVRSLRYLRKKRYKENTLTLKFNANLSRPGETTGLKIERKIVHSSFVLPVQLDVNPYIIWSINFSIFVDIRIYIKLTDQKKYKRAYNFRWNFETGRFTGSAKLNVKTRLFRLPRSPIWVIDTFRHWDIVQACRDQFRWHFTDPRTHEIRRIFHKSFIVEFRKLLRLERRFDMSRPIVSSVKKLHDDLLEIVLTV